MSAISPSTKRWIQLKERQDAEIRKLKRHIQLHDRHIAELEAENTRLESESQTLQTRANDVMVENHALSERIAELEAVLSEIIREAKPTNNLTAYYKRRIYGVPITTLEKATETLDGRESGGTQMGRPNG